MGCFGSSKAIIKQMSVTSIFKHKCRILRRTVTGRDVDSNDWIYTLSTGSEYNCHHEEVSGDEIGHITGDLNRKLHRFYCSSIPQIATKDIIEFGSEVSARVFDFSNENRWEIEAIDDVMGVWYGRSLQCFIKQIEVQ